MRWNWDIIHTYTHAREFEWERKPGTKMRMKKNDERIKRVSYRVAMDREQIRTQHQSYALKYSRINRGYYDKVHDMYAYAIALPFIHPFSFSLYTHFLNPVLCHSYVRSLSIPIAYDILYSWVVARKLGQPNQTNWTLHAFSDTFPLTFSGYIHTHKHLDVFDAKHCFEYCCRFYIFLYIYWMSVLFENEKVHIKQTFGLERFIRCK